MMDELFEQFMIEGRELISQATDDLAAMDDEVSGAGRIDSAFRAIHTLKGSVAIFDLAPMGAALHAAEDLLGTLRSTTAPVEPPVVQALLGCLDQCDRWMDALEASGALPLEAARQAVKIATGLLALTGAGGQLVPAGPLADTAAWVPAFVARYPDALKDLASNDLVAVRYTPAPDCFFAGDDPLAIVGNVPGLLALEIVPREPWPELGEIDPYHCNLQIDLVSSAAEADLRQLFRFIPDQVDISSVRLPDAGTEAEAVAGLGAEAQRTIRVESAQIDRILDLLGELVVAKNGLTHLAALAEAGTDPKVVAAGIRSAQAATDRLVADLHRSVMTVRMVPLDRVFRRLVRMVRELSERLGRDVTLDVEGADTRVDKTVADALFDPLLHIVRNAVDHGIESADARASAGKPAGGRIRIEARSLADEIAIEISDDGAGIDVERVRQTAIDRRVRTEEQLRGLDDDAATQLIFAAGFSTASRITDVSGRGVGMDVVKSAIERLGGKVMVRSRAGKGTTVALRLPATAALTTVLVVGVGAQRFAVPLDTIVETVRLPWNEISSVGLGRAFVLRSRTLPLLELGAMLGAEAANVGSDARVLVVDAAQGRVGVVVDDFSDRLDVMLRPMTGLLANVPGVAGTTLLGDGSVLLILNLTEVIG